MARPFPGRILCGIQGPGSRSHALCAGFRQLGHDAQLLCWDYGPYAAEIEEQPELYYRPIDVRLMQWLHGLRPKPYPLVIKAIIAAVSEMMRFFLFVRFLFRFDTFVLTQETSFFEFRLKLLRPPPVFLMKIELFFLRFFRKRLIFQFIGGDSRPIFLDGMHINSGGIPHIVRRALFQKNYYALLSRSADLMIDIPHQGGYYLTRPFYLLPHIGMPVLVDERHRAHNPRRDRKALGSAKRAVPLVIHCPSETGRKGSDYLLSIFDSIREKGIPFHYQIITKCSRLQVLLAMEQADLIVDQAYADSPFSKTAVEAAWVGTPVISGGFSARYWQKNFPELTELFGHVETEKLEVTIGGFLSDPGSLLAKGEKLNRFVRSFWEPAAIARRILDGLEGKLDPEWRFDPNRMECLLGGFFMPHNELKTILRKIVATKGERAFQLEDKPEVLRDLLRFINEC